MSRARIGTVETLATGAVARQALGRLVVETAGPDFTEITREIARWLGETDIQGGLLTILPGLACPSLPAP